MKIRPEDPVKAFQDEILGAVERLAKNIENTSLHNKTPVFLDMMDKAIQLLFLTMLTIETDNPSEESMETLKNIMYHNLDLTYKSALSELNEEQLIKGDNYGNIRNTTKH